MLSKRSSLFAVQFFGLAITLLGSYINQILARFSMFKPNYIPVQDAIAIGLPVI